MYAPVLRMLMLDIILPDTDLTTIRWSPGLCMILILDSIIMTKIKLHRFTSKVGSTSICNEAHTHLFTAVIRERYMKVEGLDYIPSTARFSSYTYSCAVPILVHRGV